MDLTQFTNHLEHAPLAPVYLFKGDAVFLMEEAWQRLLEKIVPPKARRFNGERLQAKEAAAAQVLTRLRVIPMFGTKQLLMVQNVEAWPKDQRTLLEDYLLHPCPTGCLVLTATQKKGMERIEPAVASVGIVVQFTAPLERDIPRWLQERAGMHGRRLASKAALFLLDQVGPDLYRLDKELEKLVLYAGDRETIEVADVEATVSCQRSFSVFELLRQVSRNEPRKAVHSLRRLMLSGEPPLTVLALLARQVRMLWQVKDSLARGVPMGQIAQQLHLPASVARGYASQSNLVSQVELYRMHQDLRKTDLAIKSTGTSAEVILEALILRLSRRSYIR